MKFGKLSNIESVNFKLPGTSEFTRETIEATDYSGPLQFYIGATGWGMKEWLGSVYPVDAKAKDFLYHYSRQFNTIELNTTHYRIPTVETVRKWKNTVPNDFKFCPKIPQSISHSKNLGIGSGQITTFCNVIAGLEENLGCCFLQLPPYFDITRQSLLEHFLQKFPKEIPIAIELRHESWFQHSEASNSFPALIKKEQQHTLITDVAGRRDVLHMQLTSNQAMIRFVGNGLHPTDYQRIEAWVNRFIEWQTLGLRTIYFFPHEPDNILAPEMARFLLELVQEKMKDVIVRGPSLSNQTIHGKQMNLFE